jgi:predicted RNA-binding Zn-ribbon protein involved in translation (DUF1610 family)
MGLLRTILRRSFFAAAAVSSLLLLATLILWPASHYRHLYARYVTATGDECVLAADSGRFAADIGRFLGGYDWGDAAPPGWYFRAGILAWGNWSYRTWNSPDHDIGPPARAFMGVRLYRIAPSAGPATKQVVIPFSYLTLLFSTLPLLALRSIRRRKAARVGLCPKCGYDLRAQHAGAGGAVCPECGTPVAGRGPSPGGEGRP